MKTEKFFVPELNLQLEFVKLGIYYRPSKVGMAINVYYCLESGELYTNTSYDNEKLTLISSQTHDVALIRRNFQNKIDELIQ